MATQPIYDKPVSVEEYLSTVYEHDCEYVDGVIEERDLGEFEHSYVQGLLITMFNMHEEDWGVFALPEQRIQTRKTHFRIPDVTILREGTKYEGILTHPPFLVIEVQSPEVPMRRTAAKAAEYRDFGIEHVWVLDPYARVAYRGTTDGLELVRTGELSIPDTPIRIVPSEIFARLEKKLR
ncbi:MAG TPA: Uma2 family endonuclease [Terracidiphilus sp.]|jgi:Uma2 family endonuclease|nr:Uma2 family endonuclease [Terracidiphilus sp.]